MDKMRVCIPTRGTQGLNEFVGEQFGRTPTYTIIDTESNDVEVIPNNSHHPGGFMYPTRLMKDKKVDMIICSNLKHRTIKLLEQSGVCVYIGAYGRVRDAIRMWRNEMLHKATNDNTYCKQTLPD